MEERRVFRPGWTYCMAGVRLLIMGVKRVRLERWMESLRRRHQIFGMPITLTDIKTVHADGMDVWSAEERKDFERMIAERS